MADGDEVQAMQESLRVIAVYRSDLTKELINLTTQHLT